MANETNAGGSAEYEHRLSESENQSPLRRSNSYVSVPTDDTIVSSGSSTDETDTAMNADHTEKRNPFTSVLDWSLELIALLVAFLSFGAMTAIISMYHNEVQPDFAYKISINTLVAIFSTVLRATLLFVISEGKIEILVYHLYSVDGHLTVYNRSHRAVEVAVDEGIATTFTPH